MSRLLYSLLLYLFTPLVFCKLLYRSFRAPAYRKRWNERLGFVSFRLKKPSVIWVHSVSVGETLASAPLVNALLSRYPDYQLLITTMTPTGSERVQALYGDKVQHCYIPYDLPFALNRFFKRVKPDIAIIVETELWPNTIAACFKRNIPTIIVNARLSERSAKGYAKLGRITPTMLQQISVVACQNKNDGKRFIRLGLPENHLHITGSIKFDINVSAQEKNSATALRRQWEKGFGRPANLFIAASTHEGEEQLIFDAFKQLKQQHKDLLLLVVPRHPERFKAVFDLAVKQGLRTIRHSLEAPVDPHTEVILGDTMGEMMKLFAASDLAFVGGSLIKRGGHNVLEPAASGLPVLSGIHTFNFEKIASELEKAQGLIRVVDQDSIVDAITRLLTDKHHYDQTGHNAKQFVERNRGALERQLALISQQLPAQ